MNIYIDRAATSVLSSEAIDVIADAVENFVFKDWFSSEWRMLSVHTIGKGEEESNRPLFFTCSKELEVEAKDRIVGFWNDSSAELMETIEKHPGKVLCGGLVERIPPLGLGLQTVIMKMKDEFIIFFISAEEGEDFVRGCEGIVGLVHLLHTMLIDRIPGGKKGPLEFDIGPLIDKQTVIAAGRRINSWLTSGRDSVNAWRKSEAKASAK